MKHLAVDFGGSSGRLIVGDIIEGKLVTDEIHRFPNGAVSLGGTIRWDFLYLFSELKKGLKKAVELGHNIYTIGIDSWGVDFGMLDRSGRLISNPYCYRDKRTHGMLEKIFAKIDVDQHFANVGVQPMEINTLCQLYSMVDSADSQLTIADKILPMPDLFAYFLTGTISAEQCIASTSQMLLSNSLEWDNQLLTSLGIDNKIMPKVVKSGSSKGKLLYSIVDETGLKNAEVIAVGSHDTASAVLSIPSKKSQKVFLSSGTWSLLGAVIPEPITSKEARNAGFTNEAGVDGVRFLQNITGLWILQRLVEEWCKKGGYVDYEQLIMDAENASYREIIDVDDPIFTNPTKMSKAIKKHFEKRDITPPANSAEFTRCVLESLAIRYKKAVEEMQQFLPEPITEIHIIGGGSQNRLLNQLTANYLNIPVFAGPVEATAMGNILMQAMAKGDIENIDQLKDILINSVDIVQYQPHN